MCVLRLPTNTNLLLSVITSLNALRKKQDKLLSGKLDNDKEKSKRK
jgi:hypothetical protein